MVYSFLLSPKRRLLGCPLPGRWPVRAVAGLRDLMKRGEFDVPASVQAACNQYRANLDTIAAFVEERCEMKPDSWTERPDVYEAYRRSCQRSGMSAVTRQAFNERLRREYPFVERERRGTWGWLGLQLRPGSL